jgi:peptidoglycan/xylan/chitin deacetylase (PgdA/CDA1 family)
MMINVFNSKKGNKMISRKFKISRVFICLLLAISCLPITGCLRAEAHREFPPEEETTEESKPVVDTRPRVALTYDDGPHEKYMDTPSRTKAIVDELDKYGYHATFFVVGNRVDGSEYSGGAAMVYAAEHGNEIGIHGYTHGVYYDTCSEEEYVYEMQETLKAIQEKIPNYKVRLMRPVGGKITNARVEESPYAIIKWNIDTLDWELDKPYGDADKIDAIVENALKNVKDGDIILMHDIYNNTYEATVIILQRLNEMGFNVVTVSELLGDNLQPGVLYEKAP